MYVSRGPGCLDPTYTLSPGLAVRRLSVQAAPRESRVGGGGQTRVGLDPSLFPAAAARRPCEAADSATLNPRRDLLGKPAARLARSPRGGRPCDPRGDRVGFRVPGRTATTVHDDAARPEGEYPPVSCADQKSKCSPLKDGGKRTSPGGGRGTLAVPTERPGKSRCPREPPARTRVAACLGWSGALPGRARCAVGRDGGRGRHWRRCRDERAAAIRASRGGKRPVASRAGKLAPRQSSTEHCSLAAALGAASSCPGLPLPASRRQHAKCKSLPPRRGRRGFYPCRR